MTVPNAAAATTSAQEESKEKQESEVAAQTMDELLGAYESELEIDTGDIDDASASKIAQEVNLLK